MPRTTELYRSQSSASITDRLIANTIFRATSIHARHEDSTSYSLPSVGHDLTDGKRVPRLHDAVAYSDACCRVTTASNPCRHNLLVGGDADFAGAREDARLAFRTVHAVLGEELAHGFGRTAAGVSAGLH